MNQSRFIDFSKLPAISGVPSFVLSHLHYCVKNSRLNIAINICIQRESEGEKEWKTISSDFLWNPIENECLYRREAWTFEFTVRPKNKPLFMRKDGRKKTSECGSMANMTSDCVTQENNMFVSTQRKVKRQNFSEEIHCYPFGFRSVDCNHYIYV